MTSVTLSTIAGTGKSGDAEDGGPARAALLHGPYGIAIGADGPAATACLARPRGVAVGPDGAVHIGDTETHRIRRLDRTLPTIGTT